MAAYSDAYSSMQFASSTTTRTEDTVQSFRTPHFEPCPFVLHISSIHISGTHPGVVKGKYAK